MSAATPAEHEQMERSVELLISWLLRIGVGTSALLVVVGLALVFGHHPSYRHSAGELAQLTSTSTEYPHTVRAVVRSALSGNGQGIAMLGLLLLIATPVMRVAVSVILFARERDRTFVLITSLVLFLLLLSFYLGAGEA